MKKVGMFLAVAFLFLNTAYGTDQESWCKGAQESGCFFSSECTQAFLNGCAAGAAAGVSVELLRNYVLPDMTSWNLHGNYGVCRDQLAGEAKVATAALGLTALNKAHFTNFKKTGAQLLGVIVGACAASYVTKLLATPAAAPAASTPAQ